MSMSEYNNNISNDICNVCTTIMYTCMTMMHRHVCGIMAHVCTMTSCPYVVMLLYPMLVYDVCVHPSMPLRYPWSTPRTGVYA